MSLTCACCKSTEGVELESSRTMYPTEPPTWLERVADIETDPNAPIPLCRECAAEHHAEWDDLWSEYYAGLM